MTYYAPGKVSEQDMAPTREGPSMSAASATADAPTRTKFVRRFVHATVAMARAVCLGLLESRRSWRAVAQPTVNPQIRLDESILDGPEWGEWSERNLSARELELMRLAEGPDRGRRIPARARDGALVG